MNIPFPKMHIAQSAINRIINTLSDGGQLSLPLTTPEVPQPGMMGQALDVALTTPPPASGAPPGTEDAAQAGIVDAAATGTSPFNQALLNVTAPPAPQ